MNVRIRGTLSIAVFATLIITTFSWAGSNEGTEAFNRGNYSQALALLTPGAESGDVQSQMILGFMYETGTGVPTDNATAAKWYRKAAEAGNAEAANKLGQLLQYGGNGLSRSYPEAMSWYRKAAAAGYSEAKYRIGYLYENGIGVCRSVEQALKWYQEAAGENIAEAGDAIARITHRGTPL